MPFVSGEPIPRRPITVPRLNLRSPLADGLVCWAPLNTGTPIVFSRQRPTFPVPSGGPIEGDADANGYAFVGDGASRLLDTNLTIDDLGLTAEKGLTIACRVRPDALDIDFHTIFASGEGTNIRLSRRSGMAGIHFAVGSTGVNTDSGLVVGEPVDIVAIKAAGSSQIMTTIYINGLLSASNTVDADYTSNGDFWIGNNPGSTGRYWNGAIWDMLVAERAWSAAEAQFYTDHPLDLYTRPDRIVSIPAAAGAPMTGVFNCLRTTVLQSGFLPVGMARESDPVQFRQQAGWGHCGLEIAASSTAVAVEALVPFVYRRRMQRLRSRKRFI